MTDPIGRRRRRSRFAAPLVVVTAAGCGAAPPAALPVETPGPLVAVGTVDAAPVDAAPVDAPLVDAAPVDAGPRARPHEVVLVLPARTVQPPGYVSCHDFGEGNRGCNPPRPVHLPPEDRHVDLLQVTQVEGGLGVTIRTDDDAGLERSTRLAALGPDGVRRPARIVEVGRSTTRIVVTGMARQAIVDGLVLEVGVAADPAAPPMDGALASPVGVTPSIIDISHQGAWTVLRLSMGRREGIDRDWTGAVIDARDRPVPGGGVTVIRVDERTTVVKVKLTLDQAQRAGRVHLRPP